MTDLILVLAIAVTPTIIDIIFQFFIHNRTVNSFKNCQNCPYKEGLDEEK